MSSAPLPLRMTNTLTHIYNATMLIETFLGYTGTCMLDTKGHSADTRGRYAGPRIESRCFLCPSRQQGHVIGWRQRVDPVLCGCHPISSHLDHSAKKISRGAMAITNNKRSAQNATTRRDERHRKKCSSEGTENVRHTFAEWNDASLKTIGEIKKTRKIQTFISGRSSDKSRTLTP